MKILLFGAQGQVGLELQHTLKNVGSVVACGRTQVDLADFNQLEQTIRSHAPDVIVNAAAYTQVDKAQEEVECADRINHLAARKMAILAQELNCWLVHYSTDYVFDGEKKSPYVESDTINPLNVYGKTKALGEMAIRNHLDKHLILRTSWVYAVHGHNFANTILKLAQERDLLNIVDDQIGAPTSAALIADTTALLLQRLLNHPAPEMLAGTYHLSAQGSCSWYGFAQYLLMQADRSHWKLKTTTNSLLPISSAQYPTPALRPKNSMLDSHKICEAFGIALPFWEMHVDEFIMQLMSVASLSLRPALRGDE